MRVATLEAGANRVEGGDGERLEDDETCAGEQYKVSEAVDVRAVERDRGGVAVGERLKVDVVASEEDVLAVSELVPDLGFCDLWERTGVVDDRVRDGHEAAVSDDRSEIEEDSSGDEPSAQVAPEMQGERDEQQGGDEKQRSAEQTSTTIGRDATDGYLLRRENGDGSQQPREVARAINSSAGTSNGSR